jgi:hypothetical protein
MMEQRGQLVRRGKPEQRVRLGSKVSLDRLEPPAKRELQAMKGRPANQGNRDRRAPREQASWLVLGALARSVARPKR